MINLDLSRCNIQRRVCDWNPKGTVREPKGTEETSGRNGNGRLMNKLFDTTTWAFFKIRYETTRRVPWGVIAGKHCVADLPKVGAGSERPRGPGTTFPNWPFVRNLRVPGARRIAFIDLSVTNSRPGRQLRRPTYVSTILFSRSSAYRAAAVAV